MQIEVGNKWKRDGVTITIKAIDLYSLGDDDYDHLEPRIIIERVDGNDARVMVADLRALISFIRRPDFNG